MSSDTEQDVVVIDPSIVQTMTVGEVEMLEERTGRAVTRLFGDGIPMGTTLRTLAYIVRHREDPEFTWEQSADLRVNLLKPAGGEEEKEPGGPKRPSSAPARRTRRGG